MPTGIEMDALRAQRRAADAQVRIANALERIATVFEEHTKKGGALDFRGVSHDARSERDEREQREGFGGVV